MTPQEAESRRQLAVFITGIVDGNPPEGEPPPSPTVRGRTRARGDLLIRAGTPSGNEHGPRATLAARSPTCVTPHREATSVVDD
ncbi:MAG: hypothetical protein ACYTG6_10255 [Planctomycetota bacterium]|jgi:hypothetical protein